MLVVHLLVNTVSFVFTVRIIPPLFLPAYPFWPEPAARAAQLPPAPLARAATARQRAPEVGEHREKLGNTRPVDAVRQGWENGAAMNEREKQFSFTRAAPSTSGRPKNQICMSLSLDHSPRAACAIVSLYASATTVGVLIGICFWGARLYSTLRG